MDDILKELYNFFNINNINIVALFNAKKNFPLSYLLWEIYAFKVVKVSYKRTVLREKNQIKSF